MSAFVRRLQKRRSFAKRLWAAAEREKAKNAKEMEGRDARRHARASLRLIRLKNRRPAFKEWSGDDWSVRILLKLSWALGSYLDSSRKGGEQTHRGGQP